MGRLLIVIGLVIAGVGLLIDAWRADRPAAWRFHDPARQLLVLLSAGDLDLVSIVLTLIMMFLSRR